MRRIRLASALLVLVLALPAFAGDGYILSKDLVYGHKAGMALTLDVIKPEAASNGIGLINVVSAGWVSEYFDLDKAMLDSRTSGGRLTTLIDKGYTIFVVRHGSSPFFKVPDAVADLRRAVRYLRHNAKELGINPDKIGVYGSSAGGHLTLMLGAASDEGNPSAEDPVDRESSRVAAVVAYYPPVDLRTVAGPNERFPALDFDKAKADTVSPILFVTKDDAPTLLVHGDADTTVPISNSERMLAAFKEAGVPADFITMPGAGHGFRGEQSQQAAAALTAWFDKYLSAK
jgi:acetyl esterase/lipase